MSKLKFGNVLSYIGMSVCLTISALSIVLVSGLANKGTLNPGMNEYVNRNESSECFSGKGVPANTIGIPGDSYVDLNSMDIYIKTENGWIKQGTLKGNDGANGQNGVSIVSITKTSTSGNVDTYTILLSNGSRVTFKVTNGVNGTQGAKGEPGDNGKTPVITIGANGNWHVNGVDTGIPARGEKGDKGDPGVGIVSILLTTTVGNIDTYTIYYSDGSTSTFYVRNGVDGAQGPQGVPGADGRTPEITIGTNGNWFVDGADTGIPARGEKGDKGDPGVGIARIEKTDTDGNVDTYTIFYTNGNTSTFTVTNGGDGIQGIQGEPGADGRTPVISIGSNGNWYIDGVDTGISAKGEKGDKGDKGDTGDAGRSITGTEIDSDGHLIIHYSDGTEDDAGPINPADLCTVKWHYAGDVVETQVFKGQHAVAPDEWSIPTGNIIKWSYMDNGSPVEWQLYAYAVAGNMDLYGELVPQNFVVTFDPDGGTLESVMESYPYGGAYNLPDATNIFNSTFDGWFDKSENQLDKTGTWNYLENKSVKAHWHNDFPLILGDGNSSMTSLNDVKWSNRYFYFEELPDFTPAPGKVFDNWFILPQNTRTTPKKVTPNASLYVGNEIDGNLTARCYDADYSFSYGTLTLNTSSPKEEYYIPSYVNTSFITSMGGTTYTGDAIKRLVFEPGQFSFNKNNFAKFGTGVESVTFDGNFSNFTSTTSLSVGSNAFQSFGENLKVLQLSSHFNTLAANALIDCTNLEHVYMTVSMRYIRQNNFCNPNGTIIHYNSTKYDFLSLVSRTGGWNQCPDGKLRVECEDGVLGFNGNDHYHIY